MRALVLGTLAALAICGAARAEQVVPQGTIIQWRNDHQFTTTDGALHDIDPAKPNIEFVTYTDGSIEMILYDKTSDGSPVALGYEVIDGKLLTTRFCWQVAASAWTCKARNEMSPASLPLFDAEGRKRLFQ